MHSLSISPISFWRDQKARDFFLSHNSLRLRDSTWVTLKKSIKRRRRLVRNHFSMHFRSPLSFLFETNLMKFRFYFLLFRKRRGFKLGPIWECTPAPITPIYPWLPRKRESILSSSDKYVQSSSLLCFPLRSHRGNTSSKNETPSSLKYVDRQAWVEVKSSHRSRARS